MTVIIVWRRITLNRITETADSNRFYVLLGINRQTDRPYTEREGERQTETDRDRDRDIDTEADIQREKQETDVVLRLLGRCRL